MHATPLTEIKQRLQRIQTLASDIEAIPNFGPDLWTMREGDKMCQQIRNDAAWIFAHLGTSSGGGGAGGGDVD